MKPGTAAAFSLLNSKAVRERAHHLLAVGLRDELPHFRIDLDRLGPVADLVIERTRAAYPSLDVPLHSRWRHFSVAGQDRWAAISESVPWRDPAERARAELDLAIVSVLLDAGAGPAWSYRDAATGARIARSEGLALASLAAFADGAFSSQSRGRLRADAAALRRLTSERLGEHFQAGADNPLPGIAGRAKLLSRLGDVVAGKPEIFGRADAPRPGGLFDRFAALAQRGCLPAPSILSEILVHLGPIWPSRHRLGGVPLGDCWRHPAMRTDDATSELVPLHKLSQWLTYSLVEPLQSAGIRVTDIDGLTGLAEYRNGGLLIDAGVLVLRDHTEAEREHEVSSTVVVEWRALTVALLDHLAEVVRARLDVDSASFPLAKVLQGGTWAAGRAIARARRKDGSPPIRVLSDGTVF